MRSTAQSPRPKFQSENVTKQLQNNVYKLFNDYYPGLVLNKIKDIGEGKYSLYYAKLITQITIGYRYIMVIIPIDNFVAGYSRPLNGMEWVSFQTRLIDAEYKIPQRHMPKPNEGVVDYYAKLKFKKTKKDDHHTYYTSNHLVCQLILLHNPKNPSQSVYPEEVDLGGALESFMCEVRL